MLSLGHLGVGRWWLDSAGSSRNGCGPALPNALPLIHPVTALPQAQRATGIAAFVHVAVLRPSR